MALKKEDSNINIESRDPNAIVKCILETFMKRCTLEVGNVDSVVPSSDPEARVAYYTGLPYPLVQKLLGKPRTSKLKLSSRIFILEAVKSVYAQSRLPTYTVIFEEATRKGVLKTNDDKLILSFNLFVEEMEILGYQWKQTINNSKIVMEDPEIRFERYMYLNKLKKLRMNSAQWQQIVYVDERLINDSQKFEKLWLADPPPKEAPGLEECAFYHAVAKSGFITGMFSNQASEGDFTKWLSDIMLMHLKCPSVIIMDNNPLHGALENLSSITRYHTRADMRRWLTNNNIPCSSNMSKPALFELIKKCYKDHKEYKIDRIIRSQGHEVLRLPHHFYDLSITTPLWDTIWKNGGVGVTNTLMHLQSQLMKLLNSIPLSKWAEYEQSVERSEKEIFNTDMAMENYCDKYELKIN